MNKSFICLAGSTIALAVASSPARAQSESSTPQSKAGHGIEEVVVTAQRRSESAQDVPIALTAIDEEGLEQLGVNSSADLVSTLPGVTVSPNGGRSALFLRGVGNNGYSTSSSVLTFVDGVYQPFDNTAGADFNNVESLALAKGPQGTLFGRNATGGVLQVTTKNPMDWQGVDLELGYGNFDTIAARGYGATKVSENVGLDLAAFYTDQDEGWGTNIANGTDAYTAKRYGVRTKLVAEVSDTLTTTIAADYAKRRGQVGTLWSPGVGYDAIFAGGPLFLGPYDISSDMTPGYESEEWGASATFRKSFGNVDLVSISSYRTVDESISLDADGGPTLFFPLFRADDRSVITQEFQVTGKSDKTNWATGVYYYGAQADNFGPQFGGPAATVIFGSPNGQPLTIEADDETNQYAAYGQATVEVLAATRLTLGARYTVEKRRLEGHTHFGPIIVPGSEGTLEETFKEPTYRVALDHDLTGNVLVYVSWSTGFNAGWFNQGSAGGFSEAANPLVKPEYIDAYEVGLKSDLLDRRLRLNVSAFYYDYQNLQQQIYRNGTVSSINAASSTIDGLDFEVVALPVDALRLSLSGTYLDSQYDDYPLAPNYDVVPGGAVVAVAAVNAKGKQLVVAPEFSVQGAATYTFETGFGAIDTTVHANYVSKIYGDPQNEFFIPDRTLIGATVRWLSSDEKTTVTLWGKNLTHKAWDTSVTIVPPNGPIGQPGAPRSYGVAIGRKF